MQSGNLLIVSRLINIRTYSVKRTGQQSEDNRGVASIIENLKDIPFSIKRIFYIYGSKYLERGGHRHKKTVQLLICVSGEFRIFTDNGKVQRNIVLNNPSEGLLIEPEDWHTMYARDASSVLLVLASEPYDVNDYIDKPYNMEYIEYENLFKVNEPFMKDYQKSFAKTLKSGWFILGNNVKQFEQEFADYLGAKYCVGVASGLDALEISLAALELPKGSEVIVPSNTYIATILAIQKQGLKPVLVEPDLATYNINPKLIEAKITTKTKAIIPVHLYGKPCEMDKIMKIAVNNGLFVIEDCAQSHGAKFKNTFTGTFGDFGAFSFYPTKNLGALGDSGAIICKSEKMYEKIKALRNYGSPEKYYNKYLGFNSRLDEVQAGFLSIKLKKLDQINKHKRELAQIYLNELNPEFIKPVVSKDSFDVYHIFAIRHKYRDLLKYYLYRNGVKTEIHYPVAPYKQEIMKNVIKGEYPLSQEIAYTILSIPISYAHTKKDVKRVVKLINEFKSS